MSDPTNAEPTPPATETPPPATEQTNTQPETETTPAGGENPPAEQKPQETPPALPEQPDALDDDITDLAKGEDERKADAEQQAKADFDAYVKAAGLENGLTDILVKKGENGEPDQTMPAQEVGAIMSALQKSGIDAGKARDMVGMVAALDQYRANAQAEADRRVLRQIREETRKEFGDSLVAASRDMVAAGQALFGSDLWTDICTIPALTNDKRFVRAMAAYGRSLRNDNGGPAPTAGGAARGSSPVFDLDAWAKGTG